MSIKEKYRFFKIYTNNNYRRFLFYIITFFLIIFSDVNNGQFLAYYTFIMLLTLLNEYFIYTSEYESFKRLGEEKYKDYENLGK